MIRLVSVANPRSGQKGYTVAGLISILIIMGLTVAVLIPGFNRLAYSMKRSMDIRTANTMASIIESKGDIKAARPSNSGDLLALNTFVWDLKPYVEDAVDFHILWYDGDRYSIIEVDAEGDQIGEPLYPDEKDKAD